jgi:hypothetical protein
MRSLNRATLVDITNLSLWVMIMAFYPKSLFSGEEQSVQKGAKNVVS